MQCKKECVKTLPLLEGAKVIVVDEGLDAMYARTLIAGWMHCWRERDHNFKIDVFSFCDPEYWYSNEPEPFTSDNVHLHDYYSIDINKITELDLENLERILETIGSHNIVIVDCLSYLILYVGIAKAIWFIKKLSTQVTQLICIYRRSFVQNKIPLLETLGTTYVKIEKHAEIKPINNLIYKAKVVHRKSSGSIMSQLEVISQNKIFQINVENVTLLSDNQNQMTTSQPIKIESSFRLEVNAQEREQRNKVPLPYTINATNTSMIHYQPDELDDIDEDDPDDDLCI